ncbi:MAG: metal-dependent transcriptional regulator [Ferroplasma sp.]|uniref:metal-dependent transcriptional regulator n=1 Tax=Ferroplasma sp. TaxID=2591003 RepID=UPI002814FBCB|nr:metal-dependent transcriptional regulator [Ferroplasma sp.]WMT52235.1 MAG: metal-dependent transcriptional regulator [Ferroplasma sp.]
MNFKNNEEDYVKTIFSLSEAFEVANENQISRDLNVSMATVSEYLNKLERKKIIRRDGRNITLTREGYAMAIPVIKKHRISEVFAVKMLEVPWEYSHSAVMDIEHTIEDRYFDNFIKNLGNPLKCPHGNSIYNMTKIDDIKALLAGDGKYRISRIVYEDTSMLKKMADLGMYPDTIVEIIQGDLVTLSNNNGELKLSPVMSRTIMLVK